MTLFLLACASTGPKVGDDTAAPETTDTGTEWGPNPIVPERFDGLWDVDASGCEGDAVVYFAFEGAIDSSAALTGENGVYWFFAEPGWDADCVDVFSVEAEESDTNWGTSDPCSGCDREFSGKWNLEDEGRGCPDFDYEAFFFNEDVNSDKYSSIMMLDPLTPSGNPNQDSATIVWAFFEDKNDRGSYYGGEVGRGQYLPETEGDYAGPAEVWWANTSGYCVDIESG